MLLPLLLAIQSAPDIELDVHATVRDVRIERSGETSLEVRAEPDGGTSVTVDKPQTGSRRHLRSVQVRIKAEARIAAPSENPPPPETASPQ